MIVSLLYRLTRRLLSVPAVLPRCDTAKDAELLVLRHENAALHRQITGHVHYEPADRLWFAALSSLLPRRRWHEIFPVQPATILAWHRRFTARKWDYSARRRPSGRPPRRRRSPSSSYTWPVTTLWVPKTTSTALTCTRGTSGVSRPGQVRMSLRAPAPLLRFHWRIRVASTAADKQHRQGHRDRGPAPPTGHPATPRPPDPHCARFT